MKIFSKISQLASTPRAQSFDKKLEKAAKVTKTNSLKAKRGLGRALVALGKSLSA